MDNHNTLITVVVGAISAIVGGLFQHIRSSRKERTELEIVTFQTILKSMQAEIDRLKRELQEEREKTKAYEEHNNELERRIIALEKQIN